jgi:hypothetical protein
MAKKTAASAELLKRADYADRLAELEAELARYPARVESSAAASIPSVSGVKNAHIGKEAVVQFTHQRKHYAVGHKDISLAGTDHTRGIRAIHLYDPTDTIVLGIVGDFENQQFGANFRLREVKTLVEGPWEASFLAITTGLRTFRSNRRDELREQRARASKRLSSHG